MILIVLILLTIQILLIRHEIKQIPAYEVYLTRFENFILSKIRYYISYIKCELRKPR